MTFDLREWWKERFNNGEEFKKARILSSPHPDHVGRTGDIIKGIIDEDYIHVAFPEFWTNTDEQHDQYPWDSTWSKYGEYEEVK